MMHKANTEYPEYVNLLKGRLTEKRFLHSLAVAKEAERLAAMEDEDEKRSSSGDVILDEAVNIAADYALVSSGNK